MPGQETIIGANSEHNRATSEVEREQQRANGREGGGKPGKQYCSQTPPSQGYNTQRCFLARTPAGSAACRSWPSAAGSWGSRRRPPPHSAGGSCGRAPASPAPAPRNRRRPRSTCRSESGPSWPPAGKGPAGGGGGRGRRDNKGGRGARVGYTGLVAVFFHFSLIVGLLDAYAAQTIAFMLPLSLPHPTHVVWQAVSLFCCPYADLSHACCCCHPIHLPYQYETLALLVRFPCPRRASMCARARTHKIIEIRRGGWVGERRARPTQDDLRGVSRLWGSPSTTKTQLPWKYMQVVSLCLYFFPPMNIHALVPIKQLATPRNSCPSTCPVPRVPG